MSKLKQKILTPRLTKSGGSMPQAQGLPNNPHPEPYQSNSSYSHLLL